MWLNKFIGELINDIELLLGNYLIDPQVVKMDCTYISVYAPGGKYLKPSRINISDYTSSDSDDIDIEITWDQLEKLYEEHNVLNKKS